MRKHLLSVAVFAFSATQALAMSDDELRAALERRFKDDRSGACVAAAVIDNGKTAQAYVCAKSQRSYDQHTAFEIGSLSKPMTAALVADLIARGELSLDDPIAALLPPGTSVPAFNGQQITIGHIVTHTSGLPSYPWRMTDFNNPYARIAERELLGTLGATRLTRPPGARWEYSNFAMMVLSYALARRSGKDYEALLQERLLSPLGMSDTYVARRPPHVGVAQGHLSNGMPAAAWDFSPDMAGMGGVRATLPDMVRFLEGELGTRESAITPALARTQGQLASVDGHSMGMNWVILPTAGGRTVLAHDGGTGGYSSSVAFDRATQRAVVLLSDTALTSLGGFGTLALHLIDGSVPIGVPRTVATARPALIDALAGSYRLMPIGIGMELRRRGNALAVQVEGQPEVEMGYDSAGDFYPLQLDALLRPIRKADGSYTFTWSQLGSQQQAERIGSPTPVAGTWTPTEAQLKEYEGSYPLMPTFGLRVFSSGAKLFIQGSGQAPVPVASVEKDVFVAEGVGAEIGFERDPGGRVAALTLRQSGQILRGQRQ
jgi:serine-type D-Ala-D-Ala carboxypeptidase/endopeptidase